MKRIEFNHLKKVALFFYELKKISSQRVSKKEDEFYADFKMGRSVELRKREKILYRKTDFSVT
jgi:hypothetical protein